MSRSVLYGAALLVPILLLTSASSLLADGELAQDSATATFSTTPVGDGIYQVTTVGSRFETDFFPATLGPTAHTKDNLLYRLLKIQETHVNKEGPAIDSERVSGKVALTAYPLDKTGKGEAQFTIEAEGDESTVSGPYFIVTRYGCCVELATHAVYSLENGKYLFNANGGNGDSGQWATLDSHMFDRIIAYHTAPTELDDVLLKGAPNAAILISYASETEPLQRVLVTVPKDVMGSDDMINWLPKLEVSNKAFPKPSDHIWFEKPGEDAAKTFTDITVQLTLDEKHKLVIPLVGDKLQLGKANLPKGWSLVEAPL
jgi:hypothetical protein